VTSSTVVEFAPVEAKILFDSEEAPYHFVDYGPSLTASRTRFLGSGSIDINGEKFSLQTNTETYKLPQVYITAQHTSRNISAELLGHDSTGSSFL